MVAIGSLVILGCGTSYVPQAPGRICFALSAKGEEVLVKDGQPIETSWTSGALIEAVSGNPAAEDHARTYVHRRRVAGGLIALAVTALGFGFIGLAAEYVGPDQLPAEPKKPESANGGAVALAGILLALGGVALVSGLTTGATSERYYYDAINTYNEDLAKRLASPSRVDRGLTLPSPVSEGR